MSFPKITRDKGCFKGSGGMEGGRERKLQHQYRQIVLIKEVNNKRAI